MPLLRPLLSSLFSPLGRPIPLASELLFLSLLYLIFDIFGNFTGSPGVTPGVCEWVPLPIWAHPVLQVHKQRDISLVFSEEFECVERDSRDRVLVENLPEILDVDSSEDFASDSEGGCGDDIHLLEYLVEYVFWETIFGVAQGFRGGLPYYVVYE